MQASYDVIVIGGGHAGAEAAWAATNVLRPRWDDASPDQRRGGTGRVAMVTMDPAKVGVMSCNPAIGGLAKGQMVREIDAMGGLMARAADATGIQFRVLNQSKGPAVRGPRCQSDKDAYAAEVRRLLATRPNLTIEPGQVLDFVLDHGAVVGVHTRQCHFSGTGPDTRTLHAPAIVLTTGTFARALMHTGPTQTPGGRVGEASADGVSGALQRLGLELGRLKTGTPPRLAADTLDLASLEQQPGDENPLPFSDHTDPARFPLLSQRCCWITHTNAQAHEFIRAHLHQAPMYNGQIQTAGPRYCPSIEDKVVRFADRTSHHVFLEPETLAGETIYCNGISTSLPAGVQQRLVHMLPGCERARITQAGYAVEYDMVLPHQIDSTCAVKRAPGLLLAGQINGTSGYEEAAGQGLIAGLNAARRALGEDEPVRLARDQAYIGVMLDDLVTKTPTEPYRMFTSRAEHRLSLRADNAAPRLTPLARSWGLVDDAHWSRYERQDSVYRQCHLSGNAPPPQSNPWLFIRLDAEAKYAGYIRRHQRQTQQLADQEHTPLPLELDYGRVPSLRAEAAAVLNHHRPATLGQAARLAGVNPPDLMLIMLAARRTGSSQGPSAPPAAPAPAASSGSAA
jgi:tRNA uridine 5-carboxymethylaminomethyl modification enzyme